MCSGSLSCKMRTRQHTEKATLITRGALCSVYPGCICSVEELRRCWWVHVLGVIICSTKLEVHWMTPNWTWILNSQKYSIYTKCLPLRPKFLSVSFTISRFRDTTCTRLSKMTPNWTWMFDSQKYSTFVYTLNTYLWGPNFAPFHSTISHFQDTTCTRAAQIGSALNDPKLNLNT